MKKVVEKQDDYEKYMDISRKAYEKEEKIK